MRIKTVVEPLAAKFEAAFRTLQKPIAEWPRDFSYEEEVDRACFDLKPTREERRKAAKMAQDATADVRRMP